MGKSNVRERTIEDYLVARVEAAGGVAEKTVSPSGRGYFDRVCVMPGGRVYFVECKKPQGSHVSKHQRMRHATYRDLGATVVVAKTLADVDLMIDRDRLAGVQKCNSASDAADLKSSME